MLVDVAAERYAGALFELSQQKDVVAKVDMELTRATLQMRDERTLSQALIAPNIPQEVKHNIVQRVFGGHASPLTLHFLHVLVDGQRFGSFEEIATRFHILMQDAQGEVAVDVETATELPADLHALVTSRLSGHTGQKPVIKWHVNPDILGGIVVRIKDNMIDYSLRSQLNQLRDRLMRVQN